jgi:hypothetical protein
MSWLEAVMEMLNVFLAFIGSLHIAIRIYVQFFVPFLILKELSPS